MRSAQLNQLRMSCGEHQSKTKNSRSQLSVKGSIEIVSAQLDHLRMSCVETSIDDDLGEV